MDRMAQNSESDGLDLPCFPRAQVWKQSYIYWLIYLCF